MFGDMCRFRSLISVQGLMFRTVEPGASTRLIIKAWITTAAFYFVLCFGLSMLCRRLEIRGKRGR